MAVARVQLAGADDPRLEDYRNVRDSELLRRRGLFIAEGRRVVERLLDASTGASHSLNLATATGSALYHLTV